MEILAKAVGRRKEAVAQVHIKVGTGQFIINNKPAQEYLQNDFYSLLSVKAPFDLLLSSSTSKQTENSSSDESLNTEDETLNNEMNKMTIDVPPPVKKRVYKKKATDA